MILSRKFVNDYTSLKDVETDYLTNEMVRIGNESESVKKLVKGNKLIIGEVISCEEHPESDHLHVCKVNIGDEVLDIICGAPNVRTGIKVIVALDGCVLEGGTIKKSVILGRESNGMLCSLSELGLDNKFLSPDDVNGIHELDESAPVGENAVAYLELDDEIIDFELTANRADLLSELGLAYEVSAITDRDVVEPDTKYNEISDKVSDEIELKVDSDNVYTFLVKKVKNIKIEESPLFIKNRLIACGIRPINNVVDISNYVMLETGQPLHFYDADSLGKCISPRMANDGEVLTTLDNVERILTSDDIVITDGEKSVGLAGVMGGLNTEIEETTKDVVIESAIFNPTNIRLTSKKILRSEASIRFEKGLDVNRCYMAIERACVLLEKYASGQVCSGLLEYNTLSRNEKIIDITLDKINSVLGYQLGVDDVKDVFRKLKFNVKVIKDTFSVSVPTRRIDISIPEDLIEEVGRIYGVDNIVGTLPVFESIPGKKNTVKRVVRDKMVSFGLNEVVTYSLINVKDVFKFTNDEFGLIKVSAPMTPSHEVLRHSLLSSLLDVFDYNKARNIKDLSIFEIGEGFSLIDGNYIEENKVACLMTGKYTLGLKSLKYDFYVVKGIVEDFLDSLGYKNRYSFVEGELPSEMHPTKSVYINVNGKIVGMFGAVHPRIYKEDVYVIEINLDYLFANKVGKLKYKEFSKYPGITKDAAFVLAKDINCDDVITTIRKNGGKLLKDIQVFDYYEGDKIEKNKKSIAYSLYFESFDKTLSDDEVTPVFESIIENVCKKHNAILRDK